MKVNKRQAESIAWSFAAVLMLRAKGTGALHGYLASIGVDGHKQPQSWDNACELFDKVIAAAWSRAGFKRLEPGEAPPEIVDSENKHTSDRRGELWQAIDAMIDRAEAEMKEFPTAESVRRERGARVEREAFVATWNRDEHHAEHQAESNPIVRCGDCASFTTSSKTCIRGHVGTLPGGTCVDWSEKR
jgi:hypothetical protein